MAGNAYVVKTEVFEGPLDLLLQLIEKRKLFINDVSLGAVTDDFVSYVQSVEKPVGQTADFILIASTLLLIKSKSLLPIFDLTEEEEQSIEDLERRLKLYKKFRELSGTLAERFGKNVLFFGGNKDIPVETFAPGKDISQRAITGALQRILASVPEPSFIPEAVVKKVVTLEEMIEKLVRRVGTALSTSFREFAEVDTSERAEVIVSFLAMLELVKQGSVHVRQDSRFADITIESEDVSVPKY